MKKPWMKRLAAAAFAVTFTAGMGMTMLSAAGEEEEIPGRSGGGIYGTEVLNPVQSEENPDTERTEAETKETEQKTEKDTETAGHTGEAAKKETAEKEQLKEPQKKSKKTVRKTAENGQTLLDVSLGDIRITETGAEGGGLAEKESSLNSAGYWITGTTDQYNVIVERNVKTNITLEDVNITCDTSNLDCINTSHADVTITLVGNNKLLSNAGTLTDVATSLAGNAITKDGMDGALTIQCEYADQQKHKCSEDTCGSLLAKGNPSFFHAGAIGSTLRNSGKAAEAGFSNFTIKGGVVSALAGGHSPGIGVACCTERDTGMYAKDINIKGGIVIAAGNTLCSGIGSGAGAKVDGIYISGGTVTATGGENAPGIGASSIGSFAGMGSMITQNIKISGGDTVVTAIGDESTNMPGIGSGGGASKVSNVMAVPDDKFQGYIQDGTSLTEYTFLDGTPFQQGTNIRVGKFYTKVYFGPYRDANGIDKDTKEQIGANNVISKTGGNGFKEEQIAELAKVTGKQPDGQDFPANLLYLADKDQLKKINEVKAAGKTGDFPLTFTTPNNTKVTVIISLLDDGTDAEKFDPKNPFTSIGANDFEKETGGSPFTEEEVKNYGQLKVKDKDGNDIDVKDLSVDKDQLKKINEAKVSGKAGEFKLTYRTSDGSEVTVTVGLIGEYDGISENTQNGEIIKGKNVISRTGGNAFTKDQLKELAQVKAVDSDGNEISKDRLTFFDEEELNVINLAKTSGKTGDFSLTFQTPAHTKVTVTVFLREKGMDAETISPDYNFSFIGADNASAQTGGRGFSEDDIIDLCRAAGKNKNGDNTLVIPDQKQLKTINEAKISGRTGSFRLVFSLKDGTTAAVMVTLTGNHIVSFDSDGGNYTPQKQTVKGGGQVIKPKNPSKTGCTFEGWFYKDGQGKEVKWDFSTPVNESMVLKAKWRNLSVEKTEMSADRKGTESGKTGKSDKASKWNYKEIQKDKSGQGTSGGEVAKTGDEKGMVWPMLCLTGGTGILAFCFYRKRIRK